MSDSESSPSSPQGILPADSAPGSPSALPDVSQIPADNWPTRDPKLAGGSRDKKYQAVVRQSVLDAIHGHGKSCTSVEVCGVLVGNVYQDEFGPYLHVNSCIRGDRAKGHAAQVTFTAETWSAIQATMDQEHADERIVGWYHTHPGFGIFLSGMDLFIQDHFFNLPWQVAFVYDPLGGDEGMFYWQAGKVERQSFLIEPDHLLITSDHSSRETAPSLAEVEAAEMEMQGANRAARQTPGESTANVPPLQLPLPMPHASSQSGSATENWSSTRAARPPRSMVPIWLLGALTFAVSFACTLWAMYSIHRDIVIIPHHVDHAATQQTAASTGGPKVKQSH